MALRVSLILLLLAMAVVAMAKTELSSIGVARWKLGSTKLACDGSVGACMDEEEEMTSELEASGRMLYGQAGYISYGALRRNTVPCNMRGSSYYNCRRSGRANPYRRGCSIITHCARILQ